MFEDRGSLFGVSSSGLLFLIVIQFKSVRLYVYKLVYISAVPLEILLNGVEAIG